MFQDVLVEIEGLKMRNLSLAGNVLELSKSHDEQKIENDETLKVLEFAKKAIAELQDVNLKQQTEYAVNIAECKARAQINIGWLGHRVHCLTAANIKLRRQNISLEALVRSDIGKRPNERARKRAVLAKRRQQA